MNRRWIEGSAAYLLALGAVCAAAAAVRAPGMVWLSGATPYPGFSFHPDVMRFILPIEDFANVGVWQGYTVGLTSQLFIVVRLLEALGADVVPLTISRSLSLGYGIATIFLVGLMARWATSSRAVGLWTAVLLALAPLHVINSHFGTPDVAATFFLYVSLLFGWQAIAFRKELDFTLFVASIGVGLATKFNLPLFVPLAIVVWQLPRRWERSLLTILILAGSFSIASFFNYTPWDMRRLLTMLRADNLEIVGAAGPLEQLLLYSWSSIRALGLGTWLFFVAGLATICAAAWRSRQGSGAIFDRLRGFAASPAVVPVSAFAAYGAATLAAGLNAARHLLPFVPLLCFVAALGLVGILSRPAVPRAAAAAVAVLLLSYQIYNAVGIERQYRDDIRGALAREIADRVPAGEPALTFSNYSLVRGTRLADEDEALTSRTAARHFVTCDIEYSRYLASGDASEIFHPFGGQARVDFYQALFGGKSEYEIAFEATRQPRTFEERLAENGVLRGLGEFTARHCVLFERRG